MKWFHIAIPLSIASSESISECLVLVSFGSILGIFPRALTFVFVLPSTPNHDCFHVLRALISQILLSVVAMSGPAHSSP